MIEGSPPLVTGLELVAALGSPVLKHDGAIRGVGVTPDGKRIVSIGDGAVVHVWDAPTGDRVAELVGTDRGLYALAISPDGTRVFAGGHEAQVFQLATRRRIARLPVKKPLVCAAAFAPDGSIVFGDDRVPRRFDARWHELEPLKGHQSRVDAIAISRDGRRALTCAGDRKIKLHALDRKRPEVLAVWDGYAKTCGFSPDGTLAWAVGFATSMIVGTTSGKSMFSAGDLGATVRLGAMSDDGAWFALATEAAIHVFALPGTTQVARFSFPEATHLAFTPDGTRLVAASAQQGITVLEVATEQRVLPSDAGHVREVVDLAIPADQPHVLFSLGADSAIVMWDLDGGTALERIGTIRGPGTALACTTDGQVVSGSAYELLAWNVPRTESTPFPGAHRIAGVAVSPDDRHVACVSTTGPIQVFDRASRELVLERKIHGGQIYGVAFVTDDLIVTVSADETAVATHVPTGERMWSALCGGFVHAVCRVGDLVLTGTMTGPIALWDLATGDARGELRVSGRPVQRARTLDGDHAIVLRASDGFDSSVIEIWSVSQRRIVASADLTPLGERASSVAGSPDGRRIYVGTTTSRILVFDRGN